MMIGCQLCGCLNILAWDADPRFPVCERCGVRLVLGVLVELGVYVTIGPVDIDWLVFVDAGPGRLTL